MKIQTRLLVAATAILLVVSASAAIWLFSHPNSGKTAKIYVDGELVRTVDLGASDAFDLETKYGVNRIRVEDGRICVEEADCPDRTCVKMGWRSDDVVPIACLPHHLVIRIEADAPDDAPDAVIGGAK